MEVRGRDALSQLPGDRSSSANQLPALTPSADVDLELGGSTREMIGGREKEMDRTHGGTRKGLKQWP